MKVLDKALQKLDGYLISISRNTETTLYELKVGIPESWVYKENDDIGFEVELESEIGSIVIIFGKTDEIVLDDLIDYVNVIVDTNKKIADAEEAFNKKLEATKADMVKEIEDFRKGLEEMKNESFSINEEEEEDEPPKKRSRKPTTTKKTEKAVDDSEEELTTKLS